jgi:hypothetical protein
LNLYDYHGSDVLSTNFGSLMPCGDWNNDGIADFMAMDFNSNGIAIWYGADGEINPQIDFYIEWYTHSSRSAFGDLNGNGKTDIVLSYPQFRMIRVYLGNQNGTRDYTIYHTFENYGWDIAIGDFNHDGYDDLAVGSKSNQTNRVWVYAGNPDLTEADPDVSVESVEVPFADVEFKAYPNPFNPSTTIKFNGKNFEQNEPIKIEIFNIKGQRVKQFTMQNVKGKMNEVIWNGTDEFKQPVSSGMYLYQIKNNSGILGAKKMMLLK